MVVIDLKTGRPSEITGALCIALGSFDGVHLGHRRVIEEAVSQAKLRGVKSAAWCITSDAKKNAFGGNLTSGEEKMQIFSSLALDLAIFEDFETVRNLSPDDFVGRYLREIKCVSVSAGFNFRFGICASGDSAELLRLCDENGIGCTVSEPVAEDGVTVSSTEIRSLVNGGEVEHAAKLLGGEFFITAMVQHGRTLGKKLGFPTVNQNFSDGKIIPKHGVYFTLTEIAGKKYPSVSNVGNRPTVGGHVCRTETHILDFDRELYGEKITVYFIKFRRPEMKFSSESELADVLGKDIQAAKEFFKMN